MLSAIFNMAIGSLLTILVCYVLNINFSEVKQDAQVKGEIEYVKDIFRGDKDTLIDSLAVKDSIR